jgi:hypothetical protein
MEEHDFKYGSIIHLPRESDRVGFILSRGLYSHKACRSDLSMSKATLTVSATSAQACLVAKHRCNRGHGSNCHLTSAGSGPEIISAQLIICTAQVMALK